MLYPVALNLTDRPCLVVGGGSVARRKVMGLLAAFADLTVVAPEAEAALHEWAAEGHLQLRLRPFEPGDATGMTLVFACTCSASVNAAVIEAARRAGALANRADEPAECDFMGMSRLDRGHLLLAVSTYGESPAVALWVRKQLETQFGAEYGRFLELIASLRAEVKEALQPEDRAAAWDKAVRSNAFALLKAGDSEGATRCLRAALGLPSPV